MTETRAPFVHAAIEEIQNTGYLSEQTLAALTHEEYALVMERTGAST